jgi:UDP-glucose 4-epimerase
MTGKILITGGCGFIGVNLIDFLRRTSNVEIVVLDKLSLGRKEYLEPYGVTFMHGDIRNAEQVAEAVDGVSAIVHLAADTRVVESIDNPRHNFDVNVGGTFTLLEAARKAAVGRFVFASTGGAIIGHAEPPVHEGMVPRPASPYGASKLFGEGYLSAYFGAYGMKTVALRFSNVYGPRSYHKGSAVAQFIRNVLERKQITVFGDGSQTRDFIYVDDICRGVSLALGAPCAGGAYQLGSGVPTSVNELLQLIRAVVGPEIMPKVQYMPARAGELLHTYSRIDRARAELRFEAQTPLSEGLRETWKWFLARAQG